MHIVITKFKEFSESGGFKHSAVGSRFTCGDVTLEVQPDCESDNPSEFNLSWPSDPGFQEGMAYSHHLMVNTLGKDYLTDGLMDRIGESLRDHRKFSEEYNGHNISSFKSGGRVFVVISKR